ncbi:DUF1641 domain-containing protein [Neptunomonas concharum]|uniref:DUF1641 domain-containing protein n=1 Tax=Neptunomonas concharum TaxID=1031538 RepID=A0A5P1RB96_9GAMM|nr:DUF1641 domain-containing protein [Neptunomonas concharum]QEQ96934.1 DUF1641 domain-containing protein [Neptunomonas concharum]
MNTTSTTIEETDIPSALSPAGQQGLEELIAKIDPLLAGGRLNRIVDLMSVVADVVDMTDDYMVEKLCKGYEEAIGGLWNAGNLARMASNEVSLLEEPPTVWGLIKMTKDPEVRRGLTFLLFLAKGIGQQNSIPLTED